MTAAACLLLAEPLVYLKLRKASGMAHLALLAGIADDTTMASDSSA